MGISQTLLRLQGDGDGKLRYRLAMQGFTDVADEDLPGVALGLRLAPGVCMVGVALGTALTSPLVIGVLIPLAAVGFLTPYSPFDRLYNRLIRHRTGGPLLPPRRAPSRFACGVATLWLTLILVAFLSGHVTAGVALGVAMVVVAALMTFGHYCIASHLYRKVRGWPAHERPPRPGRRL